MQLHSLWLCSALALASAAPAAAQNQPLYARVLHTTPITQQVATTEQVCEDEQIERERRTSGTGAVVGAIIGGVAGHALGGGHSARPRGYGHYGGPPPRNNSGATAVLGALAGGLIGNQVEGAQGGASHYETVRHCMPTTVYQQQAIGYDVTYEYAGQRYTTRLDHDPGAWLAIAVTPQPYYTSPGNAYPSNVPPANTYPGDRYQSSSPSTGTRFIGPSGEYRPDPLSTTGNPTHGNW